MKKIIFLLFAMILCGINVQGQHSSSSSLKNNNALQKSTPTGAHLDVDLNAFEAAIGAQNLEPSSSTQILLYNDLGDLLEVGYVNSTNSFLNESAAIIYTFSDKDLLLGTDGTERVRVSKAGNVGIGITNPANRLHVQADAGNVINGEFTGTTTDVAGVYGQNNTDDYYGYGVQGLGGFIGVFGEALPSGSDEYYGLYGSVGGGTGTNYAVYGSAFGSGTNYAGYFAGDATVTGIFDNPSDAKLKTAVKSMGGDILSKINTLQTKEYTYKTDEYSMMNLPKGKQRGFIAQELQAVFPNLVKKNIHPVESKDANGKKTSDNIEFLGVNYIGLIPILTKGIQELSTENTELKTEVSDLKTRLAQLEAAVEELTRD